MNTNEMYPEKNNWKLDDTCNYFFNLITDTDTQIISLI